MKLVRIIPLVAMLSPSIVLAHPPTGEQAMQILFEHLDVSLTKENEPLCAMQYDSDKTESLGSHLAMIMASAFWPDHTTVLSGECQASKQELGSKLIDSWDCKLQMTETNKSGEYISSASIYFALNQNGLDWLPGSLRCL